MSKFTQPLIYAYHSIDYNFHLGLNVLHPDKFKKHVQFIANYNESNKYKNNIVVSFDDGYESVYKYAFPIMEEYGIKGIIFPITGYIGRYNDWDINFYINRRRHLNHSQILTLSKYGWEIGSHGHSHRAYSRLNSLQISHDLSISKKILEDLISKEIDSFCPPFGDLTNRSLEIIDNIGYKKIFIQLPYNIIEKKYGDLKIFYRRNIYSINNVKSLKNKCKNFKSELIIENIIHFFSKATIVVKEIL